MSAMICVAMICMGRVVYIFLYEDSSIFSKQRECGFLYISLLLYQR